MDTMAIIMESGIPDLFITFTANPNWEDITSKLLPGQTTSDRPDIVARVFEGKRQMFME